MKLNAVGVSSKNMRETVRFYTLLGFTFPEFKDDEQHIDSLPSEGSARLMIDSHKLLTELIGSEPVASNHSGFALQYENADELNRVSQSVKEAGFTVVKEPWDAFWGQRYSVVEDPDGNKVDLYANL